MIDSKTLLKMAGRWDEWADGLTSAEAAAAVRECAADLRYEAQGPDLVREVRRHSSDDITGLRELGGVMEPVAVVIRPDGSVDAYGYIGVVDQRPALHAQ